MKYVHHLLLVVLLGLSFTNTANAQRLKLKEGNLSTLEGLEKVNIRYDYSTLSVGKFDNEADYITKKKTEYNKKEAGKGDDWEKNWIGDRTERYEPQFEELFNKYSAFMVGDFPEAAYTMIVKTTFVEPGYNIAISRRNAEIDGEVWIVSTAAPETPIVVISFANAPGRSFGGYDYDTGFRIQEAYAALGKALGRYLK